MRYPQHMSISAAILAASLLVAPAHAAKTHGESPSVCTSPTVVNDGLIEVRCFPRIPAKQLGNATMSHCRHIDAWTTGHSTEVVNGHTYRITQKVRDDVWICKKS